MHPLDEPQQAGRLIDQIYSALFGELPWQVFLEESRSLMPNGRAVLLYHDKLSQTGVMPMAAGPDARMAQKYNQEYQALNPWTCHALERPPRRVMQADEMLPRQDLIRTPFFQEFLRLQEVETGFGVTLSRDSRRDVFFSIVGADADDDVLARARRIMDLLVPHLCRTLCTPGGPVGGREGSAGTLRIDARFKIVSADAQARVLMEAVDGFTVGPLGRLCWNDPELLRLVQQTLRATGEADEGPVVHHCHLRRRDGGLPLRACIYRPGPSGGEVLGGMDCFIRLEDPSHSLDEGVRLFCALHRLTAAETSIVSGLVHGLSLEQIALVRTTSVSTVRTQMKAIYAKTGCGRQAEVMRHVAFLAGSRSATVLAGPPLD